MTSDAPTGRVVVQGTISSAAFDDGHRFVVGNWPTSPIGPMHDVMWATPDQRRILLAPDTAVADFIADIYDFDEVRTETFGVVGDSRNTAVRHERLQLSLGGGRSIPILPARRPLALTRLVEHPIARRLLGVETYGVSPTGAVEWYQATSLSWVRAGSARLDGRALGSPTQLVDPMRVGFSEPPTRPSIVSVKVTIDLPSPDQTAH